MTLFHRIIRVQVAGLTLTEPRIAASVDFPADKTQATGTVNIYNLAPANAERIYERGESITIQAGYPSTIATIFDGSVQRPRRHRQELAHITHMTLGDQVHNIARLGGETTRSYDGPVSVRQVAQDIVADMGLVVGPLDAIPGGATITNFVWNGPSQVGLTVATKRFNVKWFEDDGVIRFRAIDNAQPQPDAPTVTITPDTGLVGTPQETDEGAEVVMFLNPQVKRGGIMNVQSSALSGRFRTVALRHDADNWSGPFTTWADLRPL